MAKKKRNRKSIKNNGYTLEELGIQKDDITKEELIDIYAEAYYKALKRIENIYDNMLTLIISFIMYGIGGVLQLISLVGVIGIISGIGKLQGTALLWIVVIVIYCLFFASVIIISAKQFSNEKDSNKIYAFSSIIIALISCIISTVTFVMQFLM